MNQVYEIPLSPDYVRHWNVEEAVRELIQNAIDSAAPFEYTIRAGELSLASRGVTLSPSTLVLGVTSKANDEDAIGSFGEGYKLALLVLARNNKNVIVLNGNKIWTPEFRLSRQFGVPLLHIVSETVEKVNDGLCFTIQDLSGDELERIVESCLQMQEADPEAITVPQGQILPSKAGKLYVGGLYVCDTELRYGYNINPNLIKLERDRQTVDGWDLKNITRDMWFSTGKDNFVASLIEADVPDVAYVNYGIPDRIKEECYKLFVEQHPDGIAVNSQAQLEELVERGFNRERIIYVGGGSYYSAVTSSAEYADRVAPILAKPSPEQVVTQFFHDNKKYMQRLGSVATKKLIAESKDWRLKQ